MANVRFVAGSGLGVDDMYMVLLALRRQKGFASKDFLAAMKEVM